MIFINPDSFKEKKKSRKKQKPGRNPTIPTRGNNRHVKTHLQTPTFQLNFLEEELSHLCIVCKINASFYLQHTRNKILAYVRSKSCGGYVHAL